VQPLAETGARLADRYRLDHPVTDRRGVALWQATDEILGRSVAVQVVTGQTRARCTAITAAAARAGRVPDARWTRVLDVGHEPDDAGQTVWVVSEWVDGLSLAQTVRNEPLSATTATALVRSCAQAVAVAASHDARHGRLHPDEVLIPADGKPRLTGLELALTLRGDARDGAGINPGQEDARALGGLLFAALTGRWPLPGWSGLPAPTRGDRLHPRQLRGRLPRDLDEITARALRGEFADAAGFANALATVPTAPLVPAAGDPEERGESAWRRWAWRLVPAALVAAIGVGAWYAGSALGRVPSPAQAVAPAFPEPHQRAGHGTRQVVWSTPPHVTSFDPQGDGSEDPGGVGFAVDDDPTTQWTTDTYHDSPAFGGLKDGVGLLLDLGRPKRVDLADLLMSTPGADVQIRAGSTRPQHATDLPVVAERNDSPASLDLTLQRPTTARYWLIWFTSLPKVSTDEYRLGVAEIALQR
jgi:hypothetical protein